MKKNKLLLLGIFLGAVFILLLGVFLLQSKKIKPPSDFDSSSVLNQQLKIDDWQIKDLQGNTHLVKDLLDNTKPIFINIWASWCGPCIYEMPSIQRLYNKYKEEVTFLCVSSESLNTIREFINHQGYNFSTYQSISFPRQLKVSSIPATFILSKDKIFKLAHIGYKNWDQESVYQLIDSLK